MKGRLRRTLIRGGRSILDVGDEFSLEVSRLDGAACLKFCKPTSYEIFTRFLLHDDHHTMHFFSFQRHTRRSPVPGRFHFTAILVLTRGRYYLPSEQRACFFSSAESLKVKIQSRTLSFDNLTETAPSLQAGRPETFYRRSLSTPTRSR